MSRSMVWAFVGAAGASVVILISAPLPWYRGQVFGTLVSGFEIGTPQMAAYPAGIEVGNRGLIAISLGMASGLCLVLYVVIPRIRLFLSIFLSLVGAIAVGLAAFTIVDTLQHPGKFFHITQEVVRPTVGLYLLIVGGVMDAASGLLLSLRRH